MTILKLKYLTYNNGLPYYQRALPAHLQSHYQQKLLRIPLRTTLEPHEIIAGYTKDISIAIQVNALATQHNQLFESKQLPVELPPLLPSKMVMLSEAFKIYLSNHQRGNELRFIKYNEYKWNTFMGIVGDMPLHQLSRAHGRLYRDKRSEQGVKTLTIKRELKSLCAIIRKTFLELDIDRNNPLSHIQIAGLGSDSVQRLPFTNQELSCLINNCLEVNDSRRRAILIIAFTGMRLNEVLGLRHCDIFISDQNNAISYIEVRPHSHRRLKTKESSRDIPLIPILKNLIRQQLQTTQGSRFLFPDYIIDKNTLSNSASASLNKYIKRIGIPKSVHCLRHTMRDLLRETGATKDVIDSIGGWASGDIGNLYGKGHSLSIKLNALLLAYQSFLPLELPLESQ